MAPSNTPRQQPQPEDRARASAYQAQPLDTPDRVAAAIQELQAGAAALQRIIPVTAQTPDQDKPRLATVPVLVVALDDWRKVTTGDSLGHLVGLLQERGGLWLAKHASALIEWTICPTTATAGNPLFAPNASAVLTQDPWIRVDVTFTGAWNGRFALASRARPHANELWCLATSPLVGVILDEVVDRALPSTAGTEPVAWAQFTEALDNILHVRARPSSVIRNLITTAGWPQAHRS